MSKHVIFRCVALTAAACLLVFGFQNCAKDPVPPVNIPSAVKPIVSQMCEDVKDKNSCLVRAQCLHTRDRECTDSGDFVGEEAEMALDEVAPVVMYSGQTVSLWASLQKEDDEDYQWYENEGFYTYSDGVEQDDQDNNYFELPECDGDASNSVSYYYVQASYGSKNLKAPFLVACSTGRKSDFVADEGVERKECDNSGTCGASDYTSAGALTLVRAGQGATLQVLVDDDDDLDYKWYWLPDPALTTNVSGENEVVACSAEGSDTEACHVARVNGQDVTSNELPVPFTQDDDSDNDGCELNKISYYKAVVTSSADDEYKKTALFQVACVEGVVAPASAGDEDDDTDPNDNPTSCGQPCCDENDNTRPKNCPEGQELGDNCGCEQASTSEPSFGSRQIATQTWREGVAITEIELPVATGGRAPLRYNLSPSATGVYLARNSRDLIGSPNRVGRTHYTYTVTDANDATAMLRFRANTRCNPERNCCQSNGRVKTCSTSSQILWPSKGNSCQCVNPLSVSGVPEELPSSGLWRVGDAISAVTLPAARHGCGTKDYTLTNTPPGLSFSSNSRVLSGTPSRLGSFTMRYQISDECDDTENFSSDIDVMILNRSSSTTPVSSCPSGKVRRDQCSSPRVWTVMSDNVNCGTCAAPPATPTPPPGGGSTPEGGGDSGGGTTTTNTGGSGDTITFKWYYCENSSSVSACLQDSSKKEISENDLVNIRPMHSTSKFKANRYRKKRVYIVAQVLNNGNPITSGASYTIRRKKIKTPYRTSNSSWQWKELSNADAMIYQCEGDVMQEWRHTNGSRCPKAWNLETKQEATYEVQFTASHRGQERTRNFQFKCDDNRQIPACMVQHCSSETLKDCQNECSSGYVSSDWNEEKSCEDKCAEENDEINERNENKCLCNRAECREYKANDNCYMRNGRIPSALYGGSCTR